MLVELTIEVILCQLMILNPPNPGYGIVRHNIGELAFESRYTESPNKICLIEIAKKFAAFTRDQLPQNHPPPANCAILIQELESPSSNLSVSTVSKPPFHICVFQTAIEIPNSKYFIHQQVELSLSLRQGTDSPFTTAARRSRLNEHPPTQLRSYLLAIAPNSFRYLPQQPRIDPLSSETLRRAYLPPPARAS
jgi:hypothetical protein